MTNARLLAVYRAGLLLVLFGVVVHAPLSVWLSGFWPDYTELIKAWKEIVLFGLAIIAALLLMRDGKWKQLLNSRLVQLSLGYIVLHLLLLPLFWHGLMPAVAGLMIDLRFVAAFLLFYILVMFDHGALSKIVKTIVIGAGVVVGFGLLQITVLPDDILTHLGYSKSTITPYNTIDTNPDYVRINSTTRGPNPLGAMALLYITLLVVWLMAKWQKMSESQRWYGFAGVMAGVAVLFASFSRSAYVAVIISVAVAGALILRISRKKLLAGFGILAVIAVGVVALLGSSDWFKNVVLHEDPESSVVEKSNNAHVASLQDGVSRLMKQPLGAGVGSTGSAVIYGDKSGPTIENYYLFVAHEAGWLGLAGFIVLMVLIFRQLYLKKNSWLAVATLSSGIGLAVIGLLLPVWTDDTVSITWWALAGGIIGSGYATRTRQQKTARTT